MDGFKRFCKLNISFLSFDSKICFENIIFRFLINLSLRNFWDFPIINVFVKSSIVISSLCTILLLSEDSEVEEAEIEVVLWKTESMEKKDKLGNKL